jgi:hypothetical protein
MSGTTTIQKALNLNEAVSDTGSAICALGDILHAADIDRLAAGETSVNNLGHLINILGERVLEYTHNLGEHLKAIEPQPPA